jgi:hypothetical protein
MALQDMPLLEWPNPAVTATGGTNVLLDAAGEWAAVVLQAKENMLVSHVGIKYATVSGSPTTDNRIETVGADGITSGSLWAARTSVITGIIAANELRYDALGAAADIPAGSIFAVKSLFNSGTSVNVQTKTGTSNHEYALPYCVNAIPTPTRESATGRLPILLLGSGPSSFYYLHGCFPHSASSSVGWGSATTATLRRGMRFKLPFRARCVGLQVIGVAAGADFAYALYSDAGAELQRNTSDADQSYLSTIPRRAFFSAPVILERETYYRAVIEPITATVIPFAQFTLPSAAYSGLTPWRGSGHYTSYNSVADAWTDEADKWCQIQLLLDQGDFNPARAGFALAA